MGVSLRDGLKQIEEGLDGSVFLTASIGLSRVFLLIGKSRWILSQTRHIPDTIGIPLFSVADAVTSLVVEITYTLALVIVVNAFAGTEEAFRVDWPGLAEAALAPGALVSWT
jgi:hypothetical protein